MFIHLLKKKKKIPNIDMDDFLFFLTNYIMDDFIRYNWEHEELYDQTSAKSMDSSSYVRY